MFSNKGKEIMVEDDDVIVLSSEDEEEETPEWLHPLLRTKFWDQCEKHWGKNRAETSLFCLRCYEVLCPHCIHNESGHHLLKVRRYTYRSVVHVKDMEDLNVSVSRIQEKINISLDDLSASEADRRHRNQETTSYVMDSSSCQYPASHKPFDESAMAMLAEACRLLHLEESDAPPVVEEPGADVEQVYKHVKEAVVPKSPSHQWPPSLMQLDGMPPPAPVAELHHPKGRSRPRKQAKPQRAPFF